jgi:hypothetical protein
MPQKGVKASIKKPDSVTPVFNLTASTLTGGVHRLNPDRTDAGGRRQPGGLL